MKKIILFALLTIAVRSNAQISEAMPLPENLFMPTAMNILNGKMLFVAQSSAHGQELWSTDGTSGGTFLVKEICSWYTYTEFSAFNYTTSKDSRGCFGILGGTKMVFSAMDESNGTPQAWVTDGTNAGTFKLTIPGVSLQNPRWFKEFNGKLYFTARSSANGYEIWSTDGTIAGTSLLTNINPGTGSAFNLNWDPCFLVFNNKMFFKADNGINGIELWSTDGTAAGTSMLKDINVGGTSDTAAINGFKIVNNYNDQPFVAAGNYFYFSAYEGKNYSGGYNILYRSDGTTAGTVAISAGPIKLGSDASQFFTPQSMTLFNNDLYFFGSAIGSTTLSGGGLWHVNSATDQFTNVYPVTGRGDNGLSDDTPLNSMREYNGKLYFMGIGSGDKMHFWSTDGTNAGTKKIFQTKTNTDSFDSQEYMRSVVFNNKLYFVCGTYGQENVYATDGTTAGTTAVFATAAFAAPFQFKVYGNSLATNKSTTSMKHNANNGNAALYFGISDITAGNVMWRLRPQNLSVKDLEIKTDIIVSPNPAKETINVHFPESITNGNLIINNLLGQQVLEKKGISGEEVNINVSLLQSGIYVLVINSDGNRYSEKIIVE